MLDIEENEDIFSEDEQGGNSLIRVLKKKNFRLLWLGEGISVLGDQFYLIALPWLVLEITGNALALGTVLALAGVPRAIFMLVGGALTDKFSPRRLMIYSNLVRMIIVIILAILTLSNLVQVWMLYLTSLAFGLADAFFYPAQTAIIPQILKKRDLSGGNAIVQGTAQFSLFAGPVIAGIVIALIEGHTPTNVLELQEATTSPLDTRGIGIAFVMDAFTFGFSILMLALIRTKKLFSPEGQNGQISVIESIKQMLHYMWDEPSRRTLFLVLGAVNFLVIGPMFVGIPVIAKTRFVEGAAAYGIVMSSFGGGSLFGIILAGALPKPKKSWFGTIIMGLVFILGAGLASVAFIDNLGMAVPIGVILGAGFGYLLISLISWLQENIPPELMGRMMSVIMFASLGLAPVSQALAGFVLEININLLFWLAGGMLMALAFRVIINPEIRAIGQNSDKIFEI